MPAIREAERSVRQELTFNAASHFVEAQFPHLYDMTRMDQFRHLEEIKQLKARYCRFIDTKQWDALRLIFTRDCRFEGLGTVPSGSDVATFVDMLAVRHARSVTVHHCHTPEIRLMPDGAARGIWAMEDFVEWPGRDDVGPDWAGFKGFRGYGHYEEMYRRDGDGWRIEFLRLTRLRMDGIPMDSPVHRPGAIRASLDWLG